MQTWTFMSLSFASCNRNQQLSCTNSIRNPYTVCTAAALVILIKDKQSCSSAEYAACRNPLYMVYLQMNNDTFLFEIFKNLPKTMKFLFIEPSPFFLGHPHHRLKVIQSKQPQWRFTQWVRYFGKRPHLPSGEPWTSADGTNVLFP